MVMDGLLIGPLILSGMGLAFGLRALRISISSDNSCLPKSVKPLLTINRLSDVTSVLKWRLIPWSMVLVSEKRRNGVRGISPLCPRREMVPLCMMLSMSMPNHAPLETLSVSVPLSVLVRLVRSCPRAVRSITASPVPLMLLTVRRSCSRRRTCTPCAFCWRW